MNILLAHNYYQHVGGEEQVFNAEADLLERHGHQVYRYRLSNDQIEATPRLELAQKTIWNREVYRELRSLIRDRQIQVAHFHNTFPLISPAAYYVAKAEGVRVVQTCHNYRLLCPGAMFLRDGKVCEDCLGKSIPLSGVQHRCYRGNRVASAGVASMLVVHRLLQTWNTQVDAYVALTQFAKQKFIQGGLPAHRIVVKPNFVDPDPGVGTGQGKYALFVGRLAQEKGIHLLLEAWEQIGSAVPLRIVGDGPLASLVSATVEQNSGITWLGRRPMEEVYSLMKEAMFLVFPSRWYEGLPRTLIESFAVGTPVIATKLGSMSSLITAEKTGLHFEAEDVGSLVDRVKWLASDAKILHNMRSQARIEFETLYTAEQSYQKLIEIYEGF